MHNPVHAAIDSSGIPKRDCLLRPDFVVLTMKLRAILSFKLRWADPEGLVDRGWPQTSDSTTTSLASVVYDCESTRIDSEESCLD